MKNNIKYIGLGLAFLLPSVSFAALDGLKSLLKNDVPDLLKSVEVLIIGLAFLFFFWGVAQFILHSGDQKVREDGKQKMLWGVIALFVIISIMGLIATLGSLLGISTSGTNSAPLDGRAFPLEDTRPGSVNQNNP